jgi:hypothetical protein
MRAGGSGFVHSTVAEKGATSTACSGPGAGGTVVVAGGTVVDAGGGAAVVGGAVVGGAVVVG